MFCMIIFLFVVYSGNTDNHFIDIPHLELPILPLYVILSLTFAFLCVVCAIRSSKIDFVALLLMTPLLIHLVNSIYMGITPEFYVHYATSVLSLSVYLIIVNLNDDIEYLEKSFCVVLGILVVQIYAEALLSPAVELHYESKYEMRIPIGMSNALCPILLSFFSFVYCNLKSRARKFILTMVVFFVIALTKSRGGFIDFFLLMAILLVWRGKFNLFAGIFFLVVLSLMCIILFYFADSSFGQQFFYNKSYTSADVRFDLWMAGFDLIKQHPFLGNGFYYEHLFANPHNVVIDLLMRSGIIGLSVALSIVYNLFARIHESFENNFIRGGCCALLALFFHGLVEIVFFSYIHELIIWTFVAYLIKKKELMDYGLCYANPYSKTCKKNVIRSFECFNKE